MLAKSGLAQWIHVGQERNFAPMACAASRKDDTLRLVLENQRYRDCGGIYFQRSMMGPGLAQSLNPTIPSLNSTIFAQLSASAGVWSHRKEGTGNAPVVEEMLHLKLVNNRSFQMKTICHGPNGSRLLVGT